MKKQITIDKLKFDSDNFKISGEFMQILGFGFCAVVLFVFCYLVGINLAVSVFLLGVVFYLKFLYKDLNHKPYRLLNLTLLFLLTVSSSYFIIQQRWSIFFIPFSILPMLVTLLFSDLMISFVITVAASVTISSFANDYYGLWVLFLISGIVSSLLVFAARRRNTIINAGIIIGLIQALSFFFIAGHFNLHQGNKYLILIFNGAACGIIVVGILPIFEYLFGTITNIKLLELADFSNPVLNRLMLEAPGTYHHSLIVGNLSEAACKAIGANSLLARIGAYYHDIGKLSKPGYFTENQSIKFNMHEKLAPNMSKMVIINHVKEGIEMAKRYRLSPRLLDFIQQHHGKSLVYFFYRRALEASQDEEEVTEDGFRYPGPKPNSKETAVVLLGDSVEAAARALKEPAAARIEESVHKVINNKFIDGQLDECDLTLKDLEIIATVFIHILSGIYHTRVNYPEERSENNNKKSSKDNSHQSEKDKRDNP
jgi:hypothetical protein